MSVYHYLSQFAVIKGLTLDKKKKWLLLNKNGFCRLSYVSLNGIQ